ncbi:D-arabinono-1,4-lactone oxidase [Streptomyces sp. NBC_00932]|uniref:D-arabinono-1,4-lactone oxidase n=1 Tax=Streptomyces sp. NBC_00932 TaxID=2903690 RepID=UPI003867EFD6|nr:FAD-binding protein [Streptomyces sp. NBC_00932]
MSGIRTGLKRGIVWQNWGENQVFSPAQYAEPSNEAELLAVVRRAIAEGLSVRVAGTGHSSTPLVQTGGLLLSLKHLSGVTGTDVTRRRARALAGTPISAFGDALWEAGLALSNQGDIDKQTIAGAIATGTHGSGSGLASFSAAVRYVRLIDGNGDVVEIGEDDLDVLRAAQVSLGSLGVVIEVELEVSPKYHLRETITYPHVDELISGWDVNPDAHRHFSFLWCPTDGGAELFELPTPAGRPMADRAYTKVYDLAEIHEPEGIDTTEGHRADRSYRIYPDGFGRIFNELEYFVPREQGLDAFREIRELIHRKYPNETYPVEVRWVAADDAYLSQQYKRDNTVITITVTAGTDYWGYLSDVDAVLQPYNARPHWGKLHFTTRARMEQMFPELDRFIGIRKQFDPRGLFLNDHLRPLLG